MAHNQLTQNVSIFKLSWGDTNMRIPPFSIAFFSIALSLGLSACELRGNGEGIGGLGPSQGLPSPDAPHPGDTLGNIDPDPSADGNDGGAEEARGETELECQVELRSSGRDRDFTLARPKYFSIINTGGDTVRMGRLEDSSHRLIEEIPLKLAYSSSRQTMYVGQRLVVQLKSDRNEIEGTLKYWAPVNSGPARLLSGEAECE